MTSDNDIIYTVAHFLHKHLSWMTIHECADILNDKQLYDMPLCKYALPVDVNQERMKERMNEVCMCGAFELKDSLGRASFAI